MGNTRYDEPIRSNQHSPTDWDGGIDEMNRILDATDPAKVIKAGGLYESAATKFAHAAGVLRAQASALTGVWKGDDADATIKQMQRLQTSATNMQQVSQVTGRALSAHGKNLEWYVDPSNRPGKGFLGNISYDDAGVVAAGTMVAGPGGGLLALGGKKLLEVGGILDSAEEKAAQQHMKRLGDRTTQANTAMPERISTDLPNVGDRWTNDPRNDFPGGPGGKVPGGPGGNIPGGPGGNMPGGPGGNIPGGPGGNVPGGPGSNMPGGPGGNIPGGGLPGGGNIPGGGFPGGGNIPGNGSDLAGLKPGGGGIPGGDPFGRGGLGGSLPGGGGGIPGGGIPGGGIPGGGGLAGGMPPGGGLGGGKGGVGGGLGSGGSSARSGMMGGAPMGAGGRGGGSGEDEHERTTWLSEDEDVWGGNDGDTAPPVIG